MLESADPSLVDRAERPCKELRLAVVCYGGVSLAIYMHGVTKEIHKLVTASRGLELSPDEDPFTGQGTESVYWRALRRLSELQGVRQRVVVDIVSGTSAGGINGVFLAKAVAINASQDALRDVWMTRGDLRELIPYPVPTLTLKLLTWLIANMFRKRPRPPLDGDRMLRWLYEALVQIDQKSDPVPLPDIGSLIPSDQTLELFVTATDLSGYTRWVWSYAPKQVPDRWHRHVFAFQADARGGRLGRAHSAALALAARATSSIPGAFSPVSSSDVTRVIGVTDWPGTFANDFAAIYDLSGGDVTKAYFIDGGVLDNFPFATAIQAIERKPATTEVDRRVLYIEPDPMTPITQRTPTGTAGGVASLPGILATIWSGLSTIPRHEPIVTDLENIRDRNDRIARVSDIVTTAYDDVARRVGTLLEKDPMPDDWEGFSEVNAAATAQAADEAGVADVTYVRLKLRSTLDRMAIAAARICRFPRDSNHAAFVRLVLERWAGIEGLLEPSERPTPTQLDFIRTFDLDYRERRVRFTIKRLNELYGRLDDDGAPSRPPDRDDLDAVKAALWKRVLELRHIVSSITPEAPDVAGEIARHVIDTFDRDRLIDILSGATTATLDDAVEAFTQQQRDALNTLRANLGGYLKQRLTTYGADVYADFTSGIAGWDERIRWDLIVRYLGFPYWDRLLFPIQEVANLTELNRIEVVRLSPGDVTQLGRTKAGVKLRGVARGHFGAFFDRAYRENDYLWGRLDGAERLLWLLFEAAGQEREADAFVPDLFTSILDEEEDHLTLIGPVFTDVRKVITGELPAYPGFAPAGDQRPADG